MTTRIARHLAVLAAAAFASTTLAGLPTPVSAGGGAGVGTPGPILFVRDDPAAVGLFPQRLWTLVPGGTPVPVPNSDGAWDGRWSPDGRVIAFSTWEHGVFLINPDGSGKRPLFAPAEGERFSTPLWSPDGVRLAFWTHTNGANMHIEIADSLDGTRDVLQTELLSISDWAADGTFWGSAGVNANFEYREEIGVTTPDGVTHELTATLDIHEGAPRVSPDGTKVAFVSTTSSLDEYRVEVMNRDGSGRRIVTRVHNPTWPSWSPDGTRLIYLSGYCPVTIDLATGTKTNLMENACDAHEGFDWAALPGTATPPAGDAAVQTLATTTSAEPAAGSYAGVRALALPDPSTIATSAISASSIWPVRDGYRDTLKVSLRMKEPARSRVDIYTATGRRVMAVNFGWRTGPFAWRWTGRTATGAILSAGRYRVVTTARDLAGNVRRVTFSVTLRRGTN
jgi:dipeptidyl aminopeptidase/acylaminoacyl peptidase